MWAIDAGSTIQSVMPAMGTDGMARRVTPSMPQLRPTSGVAAIVDVDHHHRVGEVALRASAR